MPVVSLEDDMGVLVLDEGVASVVAFVPAGCEEVDGCVCCISTVEPPVAAPAPALGLDESAWA
jgi:hypothetical protein